MARRRRDRRRVAAPAGPADGAGRRPRKDARQEATAPAESPPRATADRPPREDARQQAAPAEPAIRPTADRPPRREAAAPARPSAAVGHPAPRGRRWLTWAAAAAVTGVVLYAGVSQARRAAYAARLPALPELSGQPPALREHLEAADRDARDRPTSPEAVGALGLAYHADLFLDHADRAYALAEALGAGAWRWTYYRALAHGMRGDTEGLAGALRQVVAAAPDFGPAWWRLGEAEFKAGALRRCRPGVAPRPAAGRAGAGGRAFRTGGSRPGGAGVRLRGARPRPRRPGRGGRGARGGAAGGRDVRGAGVRPRVPAARRRVRDPRPGRGRGAGGSHRGSAAEVRTLSRPAVRGARPGIAEHDVSAPAGRDRPTSRRTPPGAST